jgi:hypothetical protein
MPDPPLEVRMALGRLFRMLCRHWEPGDDEAYYKCR